MPRGNRHFRPGQVWHITHRYHQKAFLLKFARTATPSAPVTSTVGNAMATLRPVSKRDDPVQLARIAAKYQALLVEALGIAQQKAEGKPPLIREILATGTVEGLASRLNAKAAAVSYRAAKYNRTWHSLIGWQYLENSSAAEWADSMIDTIETNVRMEETDSCPKPPQQFKERTRSK